MKTRYEYNWSVYEADNEVLLDISPGRAFYLTLEDLREMSRTLEAPAVETNGCITCGAPGHDAEHHDGAQRVVFTDELGDPRRPLDECITPRPQLKENLPDYMESKGWVFCQTCPESGEWFKFTSRGRVMARQGSKLWKLDLASHEHTGVPLPEAPEGTEPPHEVTHCDRWR